MENNMSYTYHGMFRGVYPNRMPDAPIDDCKIV